MQNYSQIYADTLAEFESPLVPADRGDEGKGQVNARAVYTIHQTNPNIGHIAKSGAQTAYHGLSVDAALDRSDGTGADYLTDVDVGNGMREIRVAYTPYAPPPLTEPLPPANWVEPTEEQLTYGGPLVLKSTTPPPQPEPTPPPLDYTARFDAIDQQLGVLATQADQNTQTVLAAVQQLEQRINQIVEDAEATLLLVGKVLLLLWRDRPPRGKTGTQAVDELDAWLAARTGDEATHGG